MFSSSDTHLATCAPSARDPDRAWTERRHATKEAETDRGSGGAAPEWAADTGPPDRTPLPWRPAAGRRLWNPNADATGAQAKRMSTCRVWRKRHEAHASRLAGQAHPHRVWELLNRRHMSQDELALGPQNSPLYTPDDPECEEALSNIACPVSKYGQSGQWNLTTSHGKRLETRQKRRIASDSLRRVRISMLHSSFEHTQYPPLSPRRQEFRVPAQALQDREVYLSTELLYAAPFTFCLFRLRHRLRPRPA